MVKKWYSQSKIITTLTVTAKDITLYYSKRTLVDYFDLRKNQNLMLLFLQALKESGKFMVFAIPLRFIKNGMAIITNNLYLTLVFRSVNKRRSSSE